MSSWCEYCGCGNADTGKTHAATRLGASGSSYMRENSHLQFRGGEWLVTARSYPVPCNIVKVIDRTIIKAWSGDGRLVFACPRTAPRRALDQVEDVGVLRVLQVVRVGEAGDWRTCAVIKEPPGMSSICDAAFSPDNRLLATASIDSDDPEASFWRLA
jgi:hypothetical protein